MALGDRHRPNASKIKSSFWALRAALSEIPTRALQATSGDTSRPRVLDTLVRDVATASDEPLGCLPGSLIDIIVRLDIPLCGRLVYIYSSHLTPLIHLYFGNPTLGRFRVITKALMQVGGSPWPVLRNYLSWYI